MTLVRWTPFGAFPVARVAPRSGFVPAAEVTRAGRDAVLTIELPGVDVSSDVSVEVDGGRLVVSGRREDKSEQSDDRGRTLVRERRYGSFRRQFELPEHVGADDVSASYEHGLLKVVVKGVAKEQPEPRTITIEQPEAQTSTEQADDSEAAAA